MCKYKVKIKSTCVFYSRKWKSDFNWNSPICSFYKYLGFDKVSSVIALLLRIRKDYYYFFFLTADRQKRFFSWQISNEDAAFYLLIESFSLPSLPTSIRSIINIWQLFEKKNKKTMIEKCLFSCEKIQKACTRETRQSLKFIFQ